MSESSVSMARKIVGDNSRLGRSASDFYPTPKDAVRQLLDKETFFGTIWECACGKGDISDVLKERGYTVKSSDINDYGYGVSGVDFLNASSLREHDFNPVENIVTNPPFNLSLEFIVQAKLFARHKIAMFLKTTFLEGAKRYEMFQDKEFPLRTVYQFSKRVSFGKAEGTHKNGGMIAFAWFVWERGYVGKPTIEWIK
jgi:hypothetical protein